MKAWKYSGILLVATGILHTIVAVILGYREFIAMFEEGIINSVGEDPARGLSFWFFICGIFVILLGQVLHYYIKKEHQPAPAFLGYYLLIFSLLGCIIVPVSGFWLFIPQAIIIICATIKKEQIHKKIEP